MKHTFYYLLVLLSVTYFSSCSTDSLEELDLKKDTPETITGIDDPEKDPSPKEDPKESPTKEPVAAPQKDPLASCDDFDWTNIIDNKITIDCIVNLNGKTIDIPNNTTVIYEGGDVKNGTLNFASNGKIDGELLNASLDLNGDVQLSKDEFEFIPNRWEIVEGRVNNDVASKNKDNLKKNLYYMKELGAKTFIIDKIDAFFKVDEPSGKPVPTAFAITIPSDFHLKMTNNTHLRMQPNAYKQPVLLSILSVSNVTVEGGVLHGERDEHDYSSGGTHEWPTLLSIKAGQNIVIRNITMQDATGDGIAVSALGHSFDPHYTQSNNVLIENNKFLRNRRNNMSITDGYDITVQNNDFIDAGIHTNKSRGVAPGFAIDIEPVRGSDPRGPFQIAHDIIIRNNRERGSRVGGFTVHTGDRVIFEGNEMSNEISYSTATEITIRNNTFNAITEKIKNNGTAIVAGRFDRFERNFGSKVYGNTITGYSTGIKMSNTDLEVYENKIFECKTGLSIETITNSKIYENKITSKRAKSDGIMNSAQAKYFDNIIVSKNIIDVMRAAFLFSGINDEADQSNYSFSVSGNMFIKNGATFNSTNGFSFNDNNFKNGGIRIENSENGELKNNTIKSTSSHGVRLDRGCKNIKIENHKISVTGNFKCITQTANDGIDIEIIDIQCEG
ncbi:right-handed parallel beta-helix repeat-containing protein [Aquimarina agarilytica]|uniref:right-handed parallel beta-helix repeat-containing protein n=1 Tax=Aquimarina agarilytica TaxID=1087449 RepID=UPI0002890FC2|nr:right-handed parallel beta-helix repeat-containing protein [Aquimarina agarilytica]